MGGMFEKWIQLQGGCPAVYEDWHRHIVFIFNMYFLKQIVSLIPMSN